jgi:PKD repeat protein
MKFKYLYIIILILALIPLANAAAPVANFTSNVTIQTFYPMVVQFTEDSSNTPTTWNWSFGDGRWFNTTTSGLKNPIYQYAVAGKYTVNLTVNNTDGINTKSSTEYINLTSDNDNNLTVWSHMNGTNESTTFISEKGVAWATNGGARISTLQPKYGGASGWFPSASNSYISSPNSSVFQFGTGDFTIEFWVNVTTVGGTNEHMFSKTNNPRNQGWGLDRTDSAAGDSGWDFYMGNDSGGQVFFNTPVTNKTWTHIAVERISGAIYIYVNGNLTNSSAGFNANYDTSNPMWIGRQQNSYFNGYIDEFRISKVARWKANFTPPYNEYLGTLETIYPDVNPDSTFRYKTNPGGIAYIDNITVTRNRTIQIQNITNTSYIVGSAYFQPLYGYAKSVQLNLSYYPNPNMTLISSSIDNVNGIIEFNISKPTGFTPGTDRASIVDYTFAYINYTDGSDINSEYFGYGYLINSSTQKTYGIHNFLGTPVTYGDWNFTANFTATNLTPLINTPTTFNSTFNGSYPNRWNWSFGDGTFDNGTNSTTTHIYTSSGLKTISLTESIWQNTSITNISTNINYINVQDFPPSASFTSNITEWSTPATVQFNDTTTGLVTAWNWSFKNVTGNNTEIWFSTLQNPVHTFSVGNFSIILNASNPYGSSTTNGNYFINVSSVISPIASFTSTSSGGPYPPITIQFNDTSLNFPNQWNWSFGDGNVSALQNPLHVYTFCGIFNVSLRVENSAGVHWKNTTNYLTIPCFIPTPSPLPDERIAMRMADIGNFVVIAAMILVIALVATFIYIWTKKKS